MNYIFILCATGAAIWFRHLAWVRVVVVGALFALSLFLVGMGLTNVARFGMTDAATAKLPVECRETFRGGLLAGQHVADRYIPTLLLCSSCLAALALAPRSPRRVPRGERDEDAR